LDDRRTAIDSLIGRKRTALVHTPSPASRRLRRRWPQHDDDSHARKRQPYKSPHVALLAAPRKTNTKIERICNQRHVASMPALRASLTSDDSFTPSISRCPYGRGPHQELKAERNRRSLVRLTRALPLVFPRAVLTRALARPFVPPTPRLAIESYWGAHPIRADRLARALAARSQAPDGWRWRLGDRRSGLPFTFRTPPAPFRACLPSGVDMENAKSVASAVNARKIPAIVLRSPLP